jgi:prepilin peptidase CpaA
VASRRGDGFTPMQRKLEWPLESYALNPAVWVVPFTVTAAVLDLRTRRIPNVLTISAAVAGIVLNLWRAGAPGGMSSGAGLLIGLAAFLPFYLAGGFGAGDVKAMAAIGAFLGPKGTLLAAACSLMLGAIAGLLVLTTLAYQAARTPGRGWRLRDAVRQRFPYGVAIACGTAVSLAWG